MCTAELKRSQTGVWGFWCCGTRHSPMLLYTLSKNDSMVVPVNSSVLGGGVTT